MRVHEVLFLSFLTLQAVLGESDVCYSYLGCFSMSAPWSTWFRPLPAPQAPDFISTAFYLYTRAQPDRYVITKLPDLAMPGSDFAGLKPTFFITHGFLHDGNVTWIREMTSALLSRFDANVIVVDWGKGLGELNYLQVASNIRVVAAEVTRLGKYLISTQGSSASRWHLIGHSLGAHVFSYVSKATKGVARITALDPAQPGFEGYAKDVRLDAGDANFVDVIHTNAAPLLGFGMMGTYGDVDHYVNGGLNQPGCLTPPPFALPITSLYSLANVTVMEIGLYVACPHCRAYEYFQETLTTTCTWWGRSMNTIVPTTCSSGSSCSPMGLESINYPARGAFNVQTNAKSPYCISSAGDDSRMSKYRTQMT